MPNTTVTEGSAAHTAAVGYGYKYEFAVFGQAGDANGDTVIDASDLTELAKLLLSDYSRADTSCDVNGDGRLDILDFVRLKKYFANTDIVLA